MAENRRARWSKAVIAAERNEQPLRGGHLRIFRHVIFKIPDDVDPDGVIILPVAVRTDRVHRPALFYRAILADDKMVADTRPAVGQMPLMNRLSRHVGIRVANMVHDDCVRHTPIRQGSKRKMRLADGDARQHVAAILPGCFCDLFGDDFRC